MKICAHSERYRNVMAAIFEIQTCFGQHRVSISIGLTLEHIFFPENFTGG